MSIHFYLGKPGGGKGVCAMKTIIEELRLGNRYVVTNFAVELEPWVNGKGVPQCGLKHYLKKNHGSDFDCEKRIWKLNEEQIEEFFRYRVFVDGSRKVLDAKYDQKGRCLEFDCTRMSEWASCLFVIDEAWACFGARNWQKTGDAVQFYNAQHRKMSDEVIFVTQHSDQCDKQIRMLTQDYTLCRNYGKESFMWWKGPELFATAVFTSPPNGTQKAMSEQVFKLDVKGIGGCFDTTAGSGITGRLAGDIGERRKGFPVWTVFVALLAFCYLFPKVTDLFASGLNKSFSVDTEKFGGKPKKSTNETSAPVDTFTRWRPQMTDNQTQALPDARQKPGVDLLDVKQPSQANVEVSTNRVYLVGVSVLKDCYKVFLSDGRSLDCKSGRLGTVDENEVVVHEEHGVKVYRRNFALVLPVESSR